jgi:hypothetical protein
MSRRGKRPRKLRGTVMVMAETDVARVATRYRCSHCNSDAALVLDAPKAYRLRVEHDDGCPVQSGAVSDVPDMLRAVGWAS